MGDHSKHDFGLAGVRRSASQGRPELPFILRDRALHVPAVSVLSLGESASHLSPVSRLRPAASGVASIQRDHGPANAQHLPGQPMVMFTVKSGIGQQPRDGQVTARLSNAWRELGRISAGAVAERRTRPQVRRRVTDDGQLRPATPDERLVLFAADDEVRRDVVIVQPGRVDAGFGLRVDQAARVGNAENASKEGIESPFFSSRSWAYLSVE